MIEFKEDLFDILPQRIVWCYKECQKSYNILQEREGLNIKFIQGISDDEDEIVTDTSATHLVIFDEMLGDKDEEKIKKCKCGVHHPNLFQQSKSSLTIILNAHYLVLFQIPRDKMQIKVSTSSSPYDLCVQRCHIYTSWILIGRFETKYT